MSNVLLSQEARGVVMVTLNRLERRNALDEALIAGLDWLFAGLARDATVHAADVIAEARASAEGREGLAALLEKRNPSFRT